MKSFAILVFLTLATVTTLASPTKVSAPPTETVFKSAESGKLEFLAIGKPTMIRIKGEGPAPQGQVTVKYGKAFGEFKFALNSLSTGIEMRDSHMKEKYLETAQHPEATLKISELDVKDLKNSQDLPFVGTLSLHGVEKSVSGTYSNEGSEAGQKLKAFFKIKLSDYKIEIPTYAGIKVADEVDVKIETELKK